MNWNQNSSMRGFFFEFGLELDLMKAKLVVPMLTTIFLVTFATSSLASVRMEFCNENEFDIRWAFTAVDGGLFGAPNSLDEAVGIWGDGFYVAPAGQCKTSSFTIGADKVYFVFMTMDEQPRFLNLSLGGIKSVDDTAPVSEMCIPTDGQHFYYEPDAADYKDGKIYRCPRQASRSGRDYFQSAKAREMGIAQVSTGIRAVGDNFLTVTIPRLDDPVTYPLRRAEIAVEPEVILAPAEMYVVLTRRIDGERIKYGPSVRVNPNQHEEFGFDVGEKLFVYTLNERGEFTLQLDPKSNGLAISSDKVSGILNQGQAFDIQRVLIDGIHQGFFAYNPWAAQGLYLNASAIDRSEMTADLERLLFASIEDG